MTTKDTTMFYFKACPKCGGDMYLERDAYGSFQKCLQCGRMIDLELTSVLTAKPERDNLAA